MKPRFDVERLYVQLDRMRRVQRMSWRAVSRATGVSPSTLTRISQGHAPSADTLVALLDWYGTWDLYEFTSREQP